MAEQILFEFIADASGLQPAEQRLQALGKIDQGQASIFKQTNEELKKREAVLKQTAASTDKVTLSVTREQATYNKLVGTLKTLSGESRKVAQSLINLPTDQVALGFEEVGLSVNEYFDALQLAEAQSKNLDKSSVGLRQQLKNLTQQLSTLKLANQDNTKEYQNLVKEAGNIKDAIADAGAEIQNAGSDTRGLDNLIGSAQAVAGGFAVAQGAAALFGDEGQELQETLLKVNAAMAVLQGLQQIQNSLEKEGAIGRSVTIVQQQIRNAGIAIENGLQSKSIVVRGAATVAQYALNLAMSLNPIGGVVVALAGLIALLSRYGSSVRQAAKDTATLEGALLSSTTGLDANIEGIKRATTRQNADLEAAGARQSEIQKNSLRSEKQIGNERIAQIERLNKDILALQNSTDSGALEKQRTLENERTRLQNENADLRTDIYVKESELRQSIQGEIEAQAEKAAEREKARQEAAAKQRANLLNDQLAVLERRLLAEEKGGQLEINLQKQIIAQKSKIELEAEGLTQNQKLLIQEKALQDQLNLQTEYNKRGGEEALKAFISRNNAELSQLNISNEDKLQLTLDNIIAAAQLEADAAEGNSAAIIEINAERDEAIKAARLQSINETVQYEIDLQGARSGAYRRSLDRIVSDETKGVDERINALEQLSAYETATNDKRIGALDESLAKGLISQQEYNLAYAQLQDQQVQATETAEEKKNRILEESAKAQKARNAELIATVLDVAGQVVDTLGALYDLQAERENAAIEGQRTRVAELLESGAITEKEALARTKKIDLEERKIKQKQAERDKQLALFSAIINGANATLRALATGGPILAAIVGALSLVQIGIIANRPIPKFYKGKKDSYEGLGEVGERGTELIEQNGRMYVVDKPQVIWLGKKDKVYNPAETKAMMAAPTMNFERPVTHEKPKDKIDYKKLGKAVGENIPKTGISIDDKGIREWMMQGDTFTRYLNNRRGF